MQNKNSNEKVTQKIVNKTYFDEQLEGPLNCSERVC